MTKGYERLAGDFHHDPQACLTSLSYTCGGYYEGVCAIVYGLVSAEAFDKAAAEWLKEKLEKLDKTTDWYRLHLCGQIREIVGVINYPYYGEGEKFPLSQAVLKAHGPIKT